MNATTKDPFETVKVIEKDVVSYVAQGQGLQVRSEADEILATEFLGGIKTRHKRIESLRLEFTKPLNDTVKKLNQIFKAQLAPLEEIEAVVKKNLGDYKLKQLQEAEAKAKEEEAAELAKQKKLDELAKAAEAKGEKPAPTQEVAPIPNMVAPPKTTHRTAAGTSSITKVWKFEIISPADVPNEYKVVDEARIRAAVKAGSREIAGVRIYEDAKVSIRAA